MSLQHDTDPARLEDAFQTFNQLSEQLASSYRALESRVSLLTDELAVTRDGHYRELKEKERIANRLQSLLNALPGGVVVLDGKGLVQEANPAAEDLLGHRLQGLPWANVIQHAFAPRSDDGHEVSLVDGRRVSISTCPLGTEPGQILLLTDVTEMHELQNRLNHHRRLAEMGEMTASLAHQIRTPLASALLYSSNLKRPDLKAEDRERFGEKIRTRLRHLECLVEDMLLYAKGGMQGDGVICVTELLSELAAALETQLRQSKTNFSWSDDSTAALLRGNRQMLLSALMNLALNAMQAMGEHGQLTVIARRGNSGMLEIRVQDDGPGISNDKQEKIFNPFFTTRSDGTGLGLAVVAAVARAHQGDVVVDSQPGQGSCFKLCLPLAETGYASEDAGLPSEATVQQVSGYNA